LSPCRRNGISPGCHFRASSRAPTWRKHPFDDPGWLFDVKYDGFRALLYLEQGRRRFISRNGNMMTRFDTLAGQVVAAVDVEDAVIDGEVVAVDETGFKTSSNFVKETGRCEKLVSYQSPFVSRPSLLRHRPLLRSMD